MIDSLFNDNSYLLARLALDGLSQKQLAISNNLANVDTPGYSAQTVDFQSVLKDAYNQKDTIDLETTSPLHLKSTTTDSVRFAVTNRPGGTERADGNNVDIDTELIDLSETSLSYQAITQSVSSKLQLLQTIAQSR